ncbi:MAG: hypothetical protein JXQ65_15705 [Candidatus Marinimicrobia bacterium]|nr:hypothetical protein [Candidatus Neomarinimicrobiota bacterium]
MFSLKEEIQLWLGEFQKKGNFTAEDIAEMESHLLDQIDDLKQTGLNEEEAFLISIKRLGQRYSLIHEYSRNRIQKQWKQLADEGESPAEKTDRIKETLYFIGALSAGCLLSLIPSLMGYGLDSDKALYFFNLSYFVIFPISIFYFLKNSLSVRYLLFTGPLFLLPILLNLAPHWHPDFYHANTRILSIIHMPLSLWLVFGILYTGNQWKDSFERMNYLRFTGESFIYSCLIGLGSVTILGLSFGLFALLEIDIEAFAQFWIMPLMVPASVIIAAFLVEKKKNIVENFAPVLARLFSPVLFLTLLIFFIFSLGNWNTVYENRDLLILFDLLLVLVLALVIYTISARKYQDSIGFYDYMNFLLIIISLAVNTLALIGITIRLFEFGISPNKLAAFGENIILLANLGALGIFYFLFFLKKIRFSRIIWLQGLFLPLYFAWLYFVAIGFPLIFNFK